MKAEVAPAALPAPKAGFWSRALARHDRLIAFPFAAWALVAILNFAAQIVLRRFLAPGEFGTLQATLGAIDLLVVPLLALRHAMTHYGDSPEDAIARDEARRDSLRAARLLAIETFTWLWSVASTLLLLFVLLLGDFPRFTEEVLAIIALLMSLGALLSWTLCQTQNRLRAWVGLVIAAALVRLIASAVLATSEPWCESGLAAIVLAGFITLFPAMRARDSDWPTRWRACRTLLDRDFLLSAAATFSVLLALALFANADRIAAQPGFGVAHDTNLSLVNLADFDAYQTAGLLARSLLWAMQPLLWILFADRVRLDRTVPSSLVFFWIALGALLVGVVLLMLAAPTLAQLFCGNFESAVLTSRLVPGLAFAILPLGLLQALGLFSLASRRYPECFTLGACSLAYALVLFLFGRQPSLMIAYMFGGGLISLMVLLLIGVARWGRKQP